MINLIVDFDNLFFRSMFITGGYGSKRYSFDDEYETDQLIRKLATDISYIIRQTNASRIIFAVDSKSWRKKISIDENDGYKANRKKSDFINWNNIFNVMKEFTKILESTGFIVTKIDSAEADDIIALWRDELLFNQNQHVIMVSSDEDIRQLVHFFPYEKDKMAFSTVFNPFTSGKSSKKLFIPNYFNNWLNTYEEGDIFNRSVDVDKEDFRRLKDNNQIVINEIDGNYIALKKIFCGDDGDNVPAIFTWLNDKDKTVRITNSKFVKIINHIGAKDYLDLADKAEDIYEQIVNISGKEPPFNMEKRLNRQIKLVVLARYLFPEEIIKTFNADLDKQLNKQNINPQKWNMNSILEGTKYVNVDKKGGGDEASIFREIDRLNKKLF